MLYRIAMMLYWITQTFHVALFSTLLYKKFLVTCSETGAPDNVRDVFTSRYIEFAKKLRKDSDNWKYELAIFFAMHGGLAFGVDKRKAFDEIVAKAQEMSSF